MKRLFRLNILLIVIASLVDNSGHEIHMEQPQLVIEAIREVLEAVRSGKR